MEKGKTARSPLFDLCYLGDQSDTRISAVAPKRSIKTASGRNKIRRQIYEAVQPIFHSIISGTHAIVFAKDKVKAAPFTDISSSIKSLLERSGLLEA
jgi:ribonuclease P protein component